MFINMSGRGRGHISKGRISTGGRGNLLKMLMLMKWGFRIAWLKDYFLIFVIINDDTSVGNIGTHVPDLDVKIPFNNTLDTVYWFNNTIVLMTH